MLRWRFYRGVAVASRASDRIAVRGEWLGEVERALAASVAQWAEREVTGRRLELGEDCDALLAPARRSLLLELGLQAAPWPEEVGGLGMELPGGALALVGAIEQVGRADIGLALQLAVVGAFAAGISRDPGAVQRLAPLFCEGGDPTIPTLILPTLGGSIDGAPATDDGRQPQARGREDGSDWLLDAAAAHPIHSGVDAGLFGVVCDTGDGLGFFVVPADAPGVGIGEPIRSVGLAACHNAPVDLDAVRVPAEARIADGEGVYRAVRSWLEALSAAACVGGLLSAVDILDDWAESRVIKGRGQPFKANALTASTMGEVAVCAQVCRTLVYDLAAALARSGDGGAGAATCSVHSTVQALAQRGLDVTMELMGSAGYAREWQLERIWRDVKAIGTLLGPDVLARLQVARHTFGCTAR